MPGPKTRRSPVRRLRVNRGKIGGSPSPYARQLAKPPQGKVRSRALLKSKRQQPGQLPGGYFPAGHKFEHQPFTAPSKPIFQSGTKLDRTQVRFVTKHPRSTRLAKRRP